MPLTSHALIFIGLTALAAFLGARLASRGKSDAAGIARVEQKLNQILSHISHTGYDIPDANTPAASIGNSYSVVAATDEAIVSEIRRGRKIQAIKLYREHHPVGLKEAKDAVDRIAQELS